MPRPRVSNGERRRRHLANLAEIRSCCDTSRQLPHAPDSVRPLGRCADKVAFESREFALRRAKYHETDTDRMVAYRCQGCRLWHLGHPANEEEGL